MFSAELLHDHEENIWDDDFFPFIPALQVLWKKFAFDLQTLASWKNKIIILFILDEWG